MAFEEIHELQLKRKDCTGEAEVEHQQPANEANDEVRPEKDFSQHEREERRR